MRVISNTQEGLENTMCNYGYTNTCNSTFTQANVLNGNSCLGYNQRMCRDCCGNVWVRRANYCGCCQQHTPCCQENTDTSNCGFGFFTVFGRIIGGNVANTTNGTATTNGDAYYARQYYGAPRCGCCGGTANND